MNWVVVLFLTAGVIAIIVCGWLDYRAMTRHYNREINRLNGFHPDATPKPCTWGSRVRKPFPGWVKGCEPKK